MEGNIAIESVRLRNLLSFGPAGQEIILNPLTVLIGPNGSGKSNLIESLALLQATPRDLLVPIRTGGGTNEWLWKGITAEMLIAEIEVVISYLPHHLRYRLSFSLSQTERFEMVAESIGIAHSNPQRDDPFHYYRNHRGNADILVREEARANVEEGRDLTERRVSLDSELESNQSIFSQFKDPIRYPELTHIGTLLSSIRFFREPNIGRFAPSRLPQRADLPNDFLLEDASNLGLVLNNLEKRGMKRRIVELLQKFYEPVMDFTISFEGGTLQFFLHEQGLNQPVSAARLSDGTLHFLCLLAILVHPTPPPLVCIEEPEIGLHPDIIPTLADLLVDATKRMQLIITTHSETLVSALSQYPEAITICERDEEGTQLRQLDPVRLKEWLDDYSLGQLWRMGEIGGNRW